MARVYGIIESLQALKQELDSKGITAFKSVKEIELFVSNYYSEKFKILNDAAAVLDQEYGEKSQRLERNLHTKNELIEAETLKINNLISDLETKIVVIEQPQRQLLKKLLRYIKLVKLKKQLHYYRHHKTQLIDAAATHLTHDIKEDESFINNYKTNKKQFVEARAKPAIDRLDHILEVLKQLRPLMAGAVGEHKVMREIEKLSDDYVLINNFELSFSEPIYYKKYDQRIKNIQIDHLLISRSGIFIIETKNWSKDSVNSLSLRSPVEQIERANYALYRYISNHILLYNHHWGRQEIPIRNLIVMLHHKPEARFKYVAVKRLNELNDYLQYFEPVLSIEQVNRIADELKY